MKKERNEKENMSSDGTTKRSCEERIVLDNSCITVLDLRQDRKKKEIEIVLVE